MAGWWLDGWMGGWIFTWRMDLQMGGWLHEEWMDGQMDGWMNLLSKERWKLHFTMTLRMNWAN